MPNNMMDISPEELYILSYYRAGELTGALLFGRVALHSNVDGIRIPLTRHCAEEAEHAWLWTKTIKDLGHIPLKVTETYQTEYGREFGLPKNTLEVLALTQILEKRVMSHFTYHLSLPQAHPIVKSTLQKMIDDEKGHLSWVKVELDKYAANHGIQDIEKLMKQLEEIDQKVYDRMSKTPNFKRFFKTES